MDNPTSQIPRMFWATLQGRDQLRHLWIDPGNQAIITVGSRHMQFLLGIGIYLEWLYYV